MPTRSQQRDEAKNARKPSNAEQIAGANPASFLGKIIKNVVDVCDTLLGEVKQDTGRGANASRILAEMFMWGWIKKHAEGKYEKLKKEALDDGVFDDPKELVPGNHILAESRHFIAQCNVTEPVQKFSIELLADALFEKYKVPVIITKDLAMKAKAKGDSQCRITISERGA